MERHGEQVELSAEEASGGEKRHEVRYILAISLALVVALFAIIWATGVMSTDNADTGPMVEADVRAEAR